MLLKPQQVAKLLNVSTRTVHRQTEAGQFQAVMVGKHRRYHIDQFAHIFDVEAIKRHVDLLQNPPPAVLDDGEVDEFLGE